MGGSASRDQTENDLPSIKKLKQNYHMEAMQQRKKKSFIFGSLSWRKFIESTKKKSNRNLNMTLLRLESPGERKTNHHDETINVISGKTNGHIHPIKTVHSEELQKPSISSSFKDSLNTSRGSIRTTNFTDDTTQLRSNAFNRPRNSLPNRGSGQPAKNPRAVATMSDRKPRKHLIQASTSELLDCLGHFVCQRCHRVKGLEPSDITTWFREIDRALFKLGWHEISFIMPSSVVFVYLLCGEMLCDNLTTVFEVHCIVLTCLYMSYSYMGNEISYPLRPFLIEQERAAFWSRCCMIIKRLSGMMLKINSNSHCFTTVFRELIAYAPRPLQSHTETTTFHSRTIVNGERRR